MSRPVRSTYEFGPFCLDLSEHRLLRDGRPLPLTPKHFDVLRVLVRSRFQRSHQSHDRHCPVRASYRERRASLAWH